MQHSLYHRAGRSAEEESGLKKMKYVITPLVLLVLTKVSTIPGRTLCASLACSQAQRLSGRPNLTAQVLSVVALVMIGKLSKFPCESFTDRN